MTINYMTCSLSGCESKRRNCIYEAEEKCKKEALASGKINKNKIESVTYNIGAISEKKLIKKETNLDRRHWAKIQLSHDKEKRADCRCSEVESWEMDTCFEEN